MNNLALVLDGYNLYIFLVFFRFRALAYATLDTLLAFYCIILPILLELENMSSVGNLGT